MSNLDAYKIIKPLGSGSFSKVKLAEHKVSQRKVAIKIIKRRLIQEERLLKKVKREIKILKMFHHPHIIRLYEVIKSPKEIFLVMEYVPGGDLYSLIERNGRLSENEARVYFQQIVSAISYCHDHKVAHRDIKPENILLDEESSLKIGDFGLSNFMQDGIFLKTSCGSPNYAAPEVISGSNYCGPEADVWSIGVVLYALLAGFLPFDENNITALFSKIKGNRYLAARFTIPHHFSKGAADLVCRMLNNDSVSRITMKQLMDHPWYLENIPMHLQFKETIIDCNGTADCLSSYRANRNNREIDDDLLIRCMNFPEFKSLKQDKSQLQQAILNKSQTPFVVCYEILLDEKLKEKRRVLNEKAISLEPLFKKKTGIFLPPPDDEGPMIIPKNGTKDQTSLSTGLLHNWVYGFRCLVSAYSLMLHLFEAFIELDLEWKLVTNFEIRVRTLGYEDALLEAIDSKNIQPTQYGKHVKFDVRIYKQEDIFMLDFTIVSGQRMAFLDICASLYGKLRMIPKLLRKPSL